MWDCATGTSPDAPLVCLGPAGHLNRIFRDGSPESRPDAANGCLVALVRQRQPRECKLVSSVGDGREGKFRGEQRERVFSLDNYLSWMSLAFVLAAKATIGIHIFRTTRIANSSRT